MKAVIPIFAQIGKATLFLLALALAPALRAAEITANQAAGAVQAWIDEGASMGRLAGAEVNSSATVETVSGSRVHLVKLAGGGFVITSADDRVDPVIAFTPTGTNLVQDASNPFWALIAGDIAARERAAGITASPTLRSTKASGTKGDAPTPAQTRWASLLEKAAAKKSGTLLRGTKSTRSTGTVSDICVDSFVLSKWNQRTHNNYQNGLPCYNRYTPNEYPCGCVATAGGQLMRYWQWPTNSVTPLTKTCKVNGSNTSKTMYGGLYDWTSMPLDPAGGATAAQCEAIGKLTYDIGVAVQMDWRSGGSSANTFSLVPRLKDTFGYANAVAAVYQNGVYPYSLTELKKTVIPNCDARTPMVMSISYVSGGATYGHAVVVDGYGYSGDDFFMHVNYGWGGINDAWYSPPNINEFTTIDGFVFNAFPQATGSILSGRVLDVGGAPIAGASVHLQQGSATVASTTSDANGIYAFIASAGSYVVTADVLEGGVAVETAYIDANLASTTGTRLTDGGSWYTDSAASIGNSYNNDIVFTGVATVTPPVFSPESCLFYPTTNVTITCADADATIRYTLDGSAPDQTSFLYAGPILVDNTVTIKARAFANGKNPSLIVSATYTYDAAASVPEGDYFDDPINIAGASGTYVIDDNTAYTVENGEPWHTLRPDGNYYIYNYQYRTIWYKWTAPGSGTMTFQSSARGNGWIYPTFIAVYTGDTLASATRLAYAIEHDNNYVTPLSIPVEQGVTYRIVGIMGGDENDSGTGAFTLSWSGELSVEQPAASAFRIIIR